MSTNAEGSDTAAVAVVDEAMVGKVVRAFGLNKGLAGFFLLLSI